MFYKVERVEQKYIWEGVIGAPLEHPENSSWRGKAHPNLNKAL